MEAYLQYQARVMKRWCRLYPRSYDDFISQCAAPFRRRHAGMIVPVTASLGADKDI